MKLFLMRLLFAGLPSTVLGGEAASGCVDVNVDGYKAPDYECLSQQMGNNPDAAKAAQKNLEAQKKSVDKQAPNQIGLSTPAATHVRMGNTFGSSVKPQRP